MRKWNFFIFVLIAGLLEATFLNYLKIFNVKPNLILCLVVLASLYLDRGKSLGLACFSGILKDIFSIQFFGINTLLFPFWSFTIIKLSKKISLDNDFICATLIFITVIAHNIAATLIFISLNKAVVPWGIFLRITFLESLYTTAVFPLVSKAIKSALPKV